RRSPTGLGGDMGRRSWRQVCDRLAADRLMRDRRAQKIEEPGQSGKNKHGFQGAGGGLAKLEQAGGRPARGRAGANKLRAHKNGDAKQRHRIGPVDRREVRQSAFSFRNSRSGRGYTNAAFGASVTAWRRLPCPFGPPRRLSREEWRCAAAKTRPASERAAAD